MGGRDPRLEPATKNSPNAVPCLLPGQTGHQVTVGCVFIRWHMGAPGKGSGTAGRVRDGPWGHGNTGLGPPRCSATLPTSHQVSLPPFPHPREREHGSAHPVGLDGD